VYTVYAISLVARLSRLHRIVQ